MRGRIYQSVVLVSLKERGSGQTAAVELWHCYGQVEAIL